MRPIRLTMQGFTSFAERAEVDFTDLDLFAITGPTGSGKTSVLDAMTWALFGKTPRLGKCGGELISHGKKNVTVRFEFTVGMDRYSVARMARVRGAAEVRLERWTAEAWQPEEAAGVKDTNEAICNLIGLDFDAFKLSVILPQGEFDKFLRGDHAERRKILKSLLGLEVYDRMRDLAYQRGQANSAKEAAQQEVIDRDFANATNEYLETITADREQREEELKTLATLLQEAQALCLLANRIEAERASRATKNAERSIAGAAYASAETEARERTAEAKRLQDQLVDTERAHDQIVIDEARAAETVTLKVRADSLKALLARQAESRQKLDVTERGLREQETEQKTALIAAADGEAAYRRCEEIRNRAQARLEGLVAGGSADLLDQLAAELHRVPDKQKEITSLDERIQVVRAREQELRLQLVELEPQKAAADVSLEEARQEQVEIQGHAIHRDLRAGLKQGQPCPVCEQNVSVIPRIPAAGELDVARNRVKTCEKDLENIRERATRATTELDGVPAKLDNLELQKNSIKAEIAKIRQRVHKTTGDLEDLACSEALTSRVAEIREAEIETRTSREVADSTLAVSRDANTRAAELDRKVVSLTEQVAALTDTLRRLDTDIYEIQPDIERAGGSDQIAAELKAIESARKTKEELATKSAELRAGLAGVDQERSAAEQQVAILGERVGSLSQDLETLDESLASLDRQWVEAIVGREIPEGDNETRRAMSWHKKLQEAHNALQHAIATMEAEIESTKTGIKRLAELKAEVDALRQERELYEQVHTALRADNFIDHLLGRAYDDLCSRGSEHLLRLSGERYSFTAGKNTFNVKDAWNGDAERPAATLSGGESFFASLALALALSESVASFGGDVSHTAQLEALFLDEGVSTLDQDEALPAVVDALMQLQAGDRLIGVISHMENLAHRLPARIDIMKNHGRSTIRVDAYTPRKPDVAHAT